MLLKENIVYKSNMAKHVIIKLFFPKYTHFKSNSVNIFSHALWMIKWKKAKTFKSFFKKNLTGILL